MPDKFSAKKDSYELAFRAIVPYELKGAVPFPHTVAPLLLAFCEGLPEGSTASYRFDGNTLLKAQQGDTVASILERLATDQEEQRNRQPNI